MPKVFISHSWEDSEISRKLADYLRHDGSEIWIDYARISGGESLPRRISEALGWCDTLVLLWSKSAFDSYYVNLEWENALDLKKNIIPCLLDDTERPFILRRCLYIDFKNFDQGYNTLARDLKLNTTQKVQKAISAKKSTLKPVIIRTKKTVFRSNLKELSYLDVKTMLVTHGFFDSYWYKKGKGFDNNFEIRTIGEEKIIVDKASRLIWQQNGSLDKLNGDEITAYIDKINKDRLAGYNDWRLPTLEEGMSLMKPEKNAENLFIDPVFDKHQFLIWTSDTYCDAIFDKEKDINGISDRLNEKSWAWVVFFDNGYCANYDIFDDYSYVRAVRLIE